MASRGGAECSYEVFDDLVCVCLEDSWVLEVQASITGHVFTLDAALTPGHAEYEAPEPDQRLCYRQARLSLNSANAVVFRRSDAPAAIDASQGLDHGHIDTFRRVAGERPPMWELTGECDELQGDAASLPGGRTASRSGMRGRWALSRRTGRSLVRW